MKKVLLSFSPDLISFSQTSNINIYFGYTKSRDKKIILIYKLKIKWEWFGENKKK